MLCEAYWDEYNRDAPEKGATMQAHEVHEYVYSDDDLSELFKLMSKFNPHGNMAEDDKVKVLMVRLFDRLNAK